MIVTRMTNRLQKRLEELAAKEVACDDEEFIPYDWFSGNMDDAYWAGMNDGETVLARELLKEFFGEEDE